ncbi:hypothetical protein Ancab_023938 [Ancistrocladus abbreviatus]
MAVRDWIRVDETARDMLSRVLTERPPLLLPPLHRLPLRAGNVVEIVGPSPSAKTHILMEVAVNSILPKEWKGVYYGGLERAVMFIDLDCRFDILRLLQLLKHKIKTAAGSGREVIDEHQEGNVWSCARKKELNGDHDKELIEICLQRFIYIRCYDSFEFLATLKSLYCQLQKTMTELGTIVHFLMIDRKTLSLQSVTEAVVNELRNFLLVHPVLLLATKTSIFADKYANNYIKRASRKWSSQDTLGQSTVGIGPENVLHREYMPSVWQSFVTHRVFVRPSSEQLSSGMYALASEQVYLAEWLLPKLCTTDKFVVRDAGIFIVP